MSGREKFFSKNGRFKDVLIVSTLAIFLLFAVWKIFYTDESAPATVVQKSEKEIALRSLLNEMEGVGDVDVMINDECEQKSVVIVCDGAKDVLVVMRIKEAVSTALGTDGNDIKIYPKKN